MPQCWHRIPRLSRCLMPSRIICVSVEAEKHQASGRTTTCEHKLLKWHATACYLSHGVLSDLISNSGSRADDWWRWLSGHLNRRGSTWIYSDRAGYTFTLLGLWSALANGWGSVESAVLADPPIIVRTLRGKYHVIWCDTANYGRHSCGSGWTGNTSVTVGEEDVGILHNRTCCRIAFGKNSLGCDIVAMCEWWGREQLGPWAATAAGLAWGAYRHSYCHRPIVCHSNADARQLERSAIFGGRLSCKSHGLVSGPVTAADVNSLYPAVMRQYAYPCRLIAYSDLVTPRDLCKLVEYYVCIAKVELSDCGLPLPTTSNGKTLYSTKPGTYTLAGAELLTVCQSRSIRRVLESTTYEPADLFGAYVDHLYPRKAEAKRSGTVAEYECIKILLNSLWGKFGQRGRSWVHDPKCPAPDEPYKWWLRCNGSIKPKRYRSLAGRVEFEQTGSDPTNSFPAIAACVSAAGRDFMRQLDLSANADNVLYSDTDSLHLTDSGVDRLRSDGCISDSQLGDVRIEYVGSDAHYYGPKHYRVGDLWVIGSLSETASIGPDGVWTQHNLPMLETILSTGSLDSVIVRERRIRLPYIDGDCNGSAKEQIVP